MTGRSLGVPWRLAATPILVIAIAIVCFSQRGSAPDPNSSSPLLLTASQDNRVLTEGDTQGVSLGTGRAFGRGDKVTLLATNIDLLDGEGLTAFRVYARDANDHYFRFPVREVRRTSLPGLNVYAITVQLTDEFGFWGSPAVGDVAVSLTWRGLASNEAKLGFERTGGRLKDSPGVVPMPPEKAQAMLRSAKGVPVQTASLTAPTDSGIKSGADRRRFEEQAAFGPSATLDAALKRTTFSAWIDQQFNDDYAAYLSRYPSQPLKPSTAPADCDGTGTDDVPATCFRDTYTMYPIQQWSTKEMLYSDNQLRHRIAWALSELWVTSGASIQQSRHMVEYHKVLSANAFGNYRTLMQQMTLNPTMGDYLSMAGSTKNNPNENYAREQMQLFTIGLVMLNQDGTVQCAEHNPCQVGDTPIPTYDQAVVTNMAKVFTGWNYCQNTSLAVCPNFTNLYPGNTTFNYIDPMLLNVNVTTVGNNQHDLTAKTLLSYPGSTTTNLAACGNCTTLANITTYANNSLNQALDNIFNHPNLGPFVSKFLIQQLVESDPTPAYVGRVAAAFNNNGSGVRGDMKAVIKAILLDPEARGDSKTDPGFGKLREPMQYSVNYLRAFNAASVDRSTQSDGVIFLISQFTGMSQSPYRSPSVFNYYPPNFIIPGTTTLGPEFGLMTTGTAISRANFINQMTYGNPAVAVSAASNSGGAPNGTSIDLSDLQSIAAADLTGGALADTLDTRLLHNTMSPQMRTAIMTAVQAVSATDLQGRARAAVYLVTSSSQYQIQR